MKNHTRILSVLLVAVWAALSGCATSGNSSAKSNAPTVSGYISTSVVKKF
jgi:type IV pilus biogenesis protein CpaD/CtpE